MMPKRKTGVNKTRGYLALYDENYEAIKEHIVSHYAEKVLSTRRNELLMYIDDSGCATFKSSEGYSGNEVVHDDYIVLSVAGGDMKPVLELLPDIHPKWIKAQFSESLPEISEHLNSTVESYLENLRDRIESEIDAMKDE